MNAIRYLKFRKMFIETLKINLKGNQKNHINLPQL